MTSDNPTGANKQIAGRQDETLKKSSGQAKPAGQTLLDRLDLDGTIALMDVVHTSCRAQGELTGSLTLGSPVHSLADL